MRLSTRWASHGARRTAYPEGPSSMTSRTRPAVMLLAGLASAGLALSACGGSDSLSSGGAATSQPVTSASANADLAAKVPEKIKSKGTITIGVDASYAPNEFLATDGKTVQGF